jgi:hypothetical protein
MDFGEMFAWIISTLPRVQMRNHSRQSCYERDLSLSYSFSYNYATAHMLDGTFMAICMKNTVPWDVTPCILIEVYQRPGATDLNKLYSVAWMWPSDRRLSAKLVPSCAVRGCYVACVTEPYGRIDGFSIPEQILFLTNGSSVVLTRLSGPRSGPTTSQKIWYSRGIESWLLNL